MRVFLILQRLNVICVRDNNLSVSAFCCLLFFPRKRKLANSPERHVERIISLRLGQRYPERRQEVLQKFNYVFHRVKPCRAQLKKITKKPSPPPLLTPSPQASLRSLPGDWRCSGRVTSLTASQPASRSGSESLPAL